MSDGGGAPPLVLLGATASGKSALALAVALRIGGDVLSFDASCLYRGLDVGTAKPTTADRARVTHHLLDVLDPEERGSAQRFVALARPALASVAASGRRAILVGGTGLYLRALLRGLLPSPPPDPALRARLEDRERGRAGSLHRLLRRLDPTSAERIPAANVQRLVRCLEHRLATGRRLSDDQVEWRSPDRLATLKIGLRMPREERERRIRARTRSMLEAGWIAEVERLLASGLSPTAPALRAIGYREIVAHLAGRLDARELEERVVVATRRYAKRQDTWFAREPGVLWLDAPGDHDERESLSRRIARLATRGGGVGAAPAR